ncbi:hypothetical protein [Mixta hanseatica]|uniref:Uncharacterized protein n=1 Tax=Mixta hanseatica TaxID=2872648 RepID=A0ABY4R957_9GAMM|nr:hypothetical protein [Mixta hanseatica]UQY43316.1 hypothetical protein K6958_15685 [Mixta hanseatica]
MDNFEKNVFVNCPFDDDYRQTLLSIVFTIKYLGYIPRLSLERADSSESRISKIVEIILESKFGIHDLSRIISSEKDEHFRMNMPFELGIDYGSKILKGNKWSKKQLLILEKERYRFQKALSDLSGSDIKNHDNEPSKAIIVVRDWFVVTENIAADSGNKIWAGFNEFNAYLYDKAVEEEGHGSVDDLQIIEVIRYIDLWLTTQR